MADGFERDCFVEACLDAARASSPAEAVAEVVERALRHRAPLAETLGHTMGPDGGILHHSEHLTIQHLVFPPGYRTGIHNHLLWAVIGPWNGYEDNDLYRVDATGQLDPIGTRRADGQHVLLLDAEAIHEAAAPLDTWSAALHVYGGALFDQPASEWVGSPPTARPIDMEHNFTRYLEALSVADLLS